MLEKNYEPKSFEKRIYDDWMEHDYFRAEIDPEKTPFTIVIPPPNITGQLHMGHALNNSIQDAIIRFRRMQGYAALWLPGTDHASIATEVKIVEQLKKQGETKEMIGREEFLKRAYQWKEQYGGRIIEQLKSLGCSCDWSRLAFTMDERCSNAVKEVFVKLYDKGLIYRGSRIINWCPDCRTALSDAEVEFEEEDGFFWHIRYPAKDGGEGVVVATTRPETMLGDTAVAVNPADKRYAHLIGKTLILPLVGREIPVVADSYVDMEFGTGCVKITPAHDPNDFEVGQRHNLEVIRVMDDGGVINENGGKFRGLDRYEARKKIVEELKACGALVKIEPHRHNVGHCYRCHTTIEPIVSRQWFVKMEPLAGPAIEAVRSGEIRFLPKRFEKIYFNWMENIRDWCISRQLWWGHRIPAYYCEDCGHTVVAKEEPSVCPACGGHRFRQDEDVLDTWFSSALWPFSTLGYPEKTADLSYFYPTDVLVTAYDIIFFWVARMIFSGLEHMGEIPFKKVLFTGLVRDAQGRKMSKSLGNGIDPLEIIDKYGADTLRFSLLNGIAPGGDTRFSEEKVEGCRNFVNKLWNASRFVLMNAGEEVPKPDPDRFTLADKWILHRLNEVTAEVNANMERCELGLAGAKLYDFIWSDFCDWYIEMAKPLLYGEDLPAKKNTLAVLISVLTDTLKLIHPFIPFVTEEIYQKIPGTSGSIMVAAYPAEREDRRYPGEASAMESVMEVIRSIRNLKAEMGVPPAKKLNFYVVEHGGDAAHRASLYLEKLGNAAEVRFLKEASELSGQAAVINSTLFDVYLAMGELVDREKELARLAAERKNAEAELNRAKGKLANQGFVSKAPQALIDAEREKAEKYARLCEQIEEKMRALGG